ncbi:glycosyltransferase family 2 protein [Undibacterium sp. CY18W]|uniref:Glycosyltransferase family 2 protein n=1 Tax=Undibacterium hunanense TaxID=2762292 RepID=A0ABR6ZQ06_9BURK|nr:glycosyltransferase family 2 protein [Undibacterium hunanense]MBC3917986.1 glycosyltransferase family 2 protein [Undibacterium hunanense]
MTSTRISIALCTYNGATYLQEQLQSFRTQSHRPYELVVCDDQSTDATTELIRAFASEVAFPVRLSINQDRLGSRLNFARAIALCSGDVIALSDQDDVWRGDKLEKISQTFIDDSVTAVFSDAEVTDASLQSLGYSMWQGLKFDAHAIQYMQAGAGFELLLKRFLVMGASLAFRTSLREMILPIPPAWHHDAWIALLAAACGNIAPIDECLLQYRQHGNNQIGGRKKSLLSQIQNALQVDRETYLRDELALWTTLQQRLPRSGQVIPEHLSGIDDKCAHLQRRMDFPKPRWRRLPAIAAELQSGAYARYARNWGSVALDVLMK